MDAAPAAFLALCCLLAPVGGVVALGAPDAPAEPAHQRAATLQEGEAGMTVVARNGTAEYLAPAPDGVDRTGQRDTSLDVAAAVGSNAGEVRVTYRQAAIDRAYRDAENVEERREVVANGTTTLSRRVDQLERTEREVVQRYSDGEVGETQLLRTLAMVHREAAATEATLSWLERRADRLGMDETERELATQQIRLVPLQGPVRGIVDESLDGERDARVYVETSGRGIVLATVEEGAADEPVYVREAHDPTAKTVNIADRWNGRLAPAEERIEELYPWVSENGNPSVSLWGPPQVRLYRFTYTHPHGELDLYLDSGSAEVLRETQRTDPELVPTETETVEEGDYRLSVQTTHPGGPVGVELVATDDGEPVDARVEVNGEAVGSTEEEVLWTVAPRGQLTVNATRRGQTLQYNTTVG